MGADGGGVAVLAGALLVGCGGSAQKLGGSGGSGCADYASDFCAEFQTCAPGLLQIIYGDVSGCRKGYSVSCNDALAAPGASWTSSQAEQCGKAYAGMDCTTFLGEGGIPAACLVRPGTVANGGPCSTPSQCASGRCSLTTIGACGICAAAAPLGQPCTPNEYLGGTCANDLVCALASVGGTSTVCAAAVPIGGACADSAVCPLDAYCDGVTHVCTKLPAVGQSCDPTQVYFCDPAQAGAVCDGTPSSCQPVTTTSSDGGCGVDGGGGTCTPPAIDGGACASNDLCDVNTGCFDLDACATFVCAGGQPGGASTAALEPTRRSRLRLPRRLASPFASRD